MTDSTTPAGTTPNLGLPLLYAAQAQKEITHNEALLLIDALLARRVESMAADPSSLWQRPGLCWIVAPGATGAFAAKDNWFACWTEGGWRFLPPREGLRLFNGALGADMFFRAGSWSLAAAWAAPSGGSTIDAEARSALVVLAAAVRNLGLLAPE